MTVDSHERLVQLLKQLSYRRMRVTLASGRESDFYVDGKQTTLNAEGAWLVGNLIFDALSPDIVGIGGLVVGADPVAAATAAVSFHRGRPITRSSCAKRPKATARCAMSRGVKIFQLAPKFAWSKTR